MGDLYAWVEATWDESLPWLSVPVYDVSDQPVGLFSPDTLRDFSVVIKPEYVLEPGEYNTSTFIHLLGVPSDPIEIPLSITFTAGSDLGDRAPIIVGPISNMPGSYSPWIHVEEDGETIHRT